MKRDRFGLEALWQRTRAELLEIGQRPFDDVALSSADAMRKAIASRCAEAERVFDRLVFTIQCRHGARWAAEARELADRQAAKLRELLEQRGLVDD